VNHSRNLAWYGPGTRHRAAGAGALRAVGGARLATTGVWTEHVRAHYGALIDPIGPRAPLRLPCQVHDRDLWFADEPWRLERAKELCTSCPVLHGCLAGAVQREEAAGVWGGQIFDRGRIVTHKRSRGRPRKNSTAPQRRPASSVSLVLAAATPRNHAEASDLEPRAKRDYPGA
jgi:WhiB family redox-sensing transcriptional regulator